MRRGEADREKEPAFPVVYMTCAAADDWASQGVPNSILLQKPFASAPGTAVSQPLNDVGTPPLSVTFRLLNAARTPTARQVKPQLSLQGSDKFLMIEQLQNEGLGHGR
jgi:hypothetical protein